MSAITAASAYTKTSFSPARETPASSNSNKGIRLNGRLDAAGECRHRFGNAGDQAVVNRVVDAEIGVSD